MPYSCKMEIFADVLLFAGMGLGLLSIPFGFPGAAIAFTSAVAYAFLTRFNGAIGWTLLVMFAVLTLIAETADNWFTAVGARRHGASKAAMWLSLAGGLLGAIILGAPLAFVAGPLGPIAGSFAGAFAIVVAYEYSQRKNLREALRAGWGTFLGRMAGMALKAVITLAMIVTAAFARFT